ncbi:MAG: MATE family efflux transporter [Oscillospiraceae bacterium]|nr:MATE family efflux transporter [Oscillospiraceae bacterium]
MTTIFKQPKKFYRNVAALMIPMVLQNIITHTVGLTDTLMVGMIGERYLAAMPIAMVPLFIVLIFSFGVQSGTSILVAQYWGKGNVPVISRVMGVGLYIVITVTLACALVMYFFPHNILGLVTSETHLVDIAAPYARIVAFSMVLSAISMLYFAVHRSTENPRLGVIVLSISACFSIFWNWVLIFGNLGFPELGIQGAAISTLSARTLEVIICIFHAAFNKRFRIKLGLIFRPGIIIFKDFMKYSLPVLLNEALWGIGAMMLPVIFGHMIGAQTILAAYNISSNLERFFGVAMFACGGASAVIIGREIGAGRKAQAESYVKTLTAMGLLLGVGSAALLMLLRFTILEPIIFPLYNLSAAASGAATTMLTIYAILLPLRAMGITMGLGAMRGGGDVKALMIIDVGTLYIVMLPLAASAGLIFRLDIGFVYGALLIEEIIKTSLIFRRIRSRKWVHDVTREQIE